MCNWTKTWAAFEISKQRQGVQTDMLVCYKSMTLISNMLLVDENLFYEQDVQDYSHSWNMRLNFLKIDVRNLGHRNARFC